MEFTRALLDAFLVAARGAEVALHLSPLLVLTPAAIASAKLGSRMALADVSWAYTLRALQRLGPAFVK